MYQYTLTKKAIAILFGMLKINHSKNLIFQIQKYSLIFLNNKEGKS